MFNYQELGAVELSATKKDYYQIWNELMELAQKLSERWDPSATNESDPGIVLLKVLTAIADKLSYSIDMNTLEAFMPSAAQETSMRRLCDMLGYTMKYFTSATTTARIIYNKASTDNAFPANGVITIDKFSSLKDIDDSINYITLSPVYFTANNTASDVDCIEGQLVECEADDSGVIDLRHLDDNLRYFLPEAQVASNGIFICNYTTDVFNNLVDGEEWVSVDNLNTQLLASKVFKFNFDSDRQLPYIQFPEDVSSLIGQGLHIRYIRTSGHAGNISANTLCKLEKPLSWSSSDEDGIFLLPENYTVTNTLAARQGSDPESIESAYLNYKHTIGTFDTLVTCRDYMNKIYNMQMSRTDATPLVSNIRVCDIRDDINYAYTKCTMGDNGIEYRSVPMPKSEPGPLDSLANEKQLGHFDLVLYPFTTVFGRNSKEEFEQSFSYSSENLAAMKLALANNKTISHNFTTPQSSAIACIKNYFRINAIITTNKKVVAAEQELIEKHVHTALYKAFNLRQMSWGEELPYDSILSTIENADLNIRTVSLDEPEIYTVVSLVDGTEYPIQNLGEHESLEFFTDSVLQDGEKEFGYSSLSALAKETAMGFDELLKVAAKDDETIDTKKAKEAFNNLKGKYYHNKLVAANIISGRIPLFNFDTSFDTDYSETAGDYIYKVYEVHEDSLQEVEPGDDKLPVFFGGNEEAAPKTPEAIISEIQSDCVIDLDALSLEKTGLTLESNEVIQFRAPNFSTEQTYPAYINYYLYLGTGLTSPSYPATFQTLLEFMDGRVSTCNNFGAWTIKLSWEEKLKAFEDFVKKKGIVDGLTKEVLKLLPKVDNTEANTAKNTAYATLMATYGAVLYKDAGTWCYIDAAVLQAWGYQADTATLHAIQVQVSDGNVYVPTLTKANFMSWQSWLNSLWESYPEIVRVDCEDSIANCRAVNNATSLMYPPAFKDCTVYSALDQTIYYGNTSDRIYTKQIDANKNVSYSYNDNFSFNNIDIPKFIGIYSASARDFNRTEGELISADGIKYSPISELNLQATSISDVFVQRFWLGNALSGLPSAPSQETEVHLIIYSDDFKDNKNNLPYYQFSGKNTYTMNGIGQDAEALVIPADCDYMLKAGQYLLINYKSSGSQEDAIQQQTTIVNKFYGQGTIIRPNFKLVDSASLFKSVRPTKTSDFGPWITPSGQTISEIHGMYTCGPTEQIEIRKPVQVTLNSSLANIYWERADEEANTSDGKIFFTFQEGDNKDSYTLKEGEYFYFTDANKVNIAYYGAGTVIQRGKDCPVIYKLKTDRKITAEQLDEVGSMAAIPWRPYNFSNNNNDNNNGLVLTEYQYLNLIKGDTLYKLNIEEHNKLGRNFQKVKYAQYSFGSEAPTRLPEINAGSVGGWEVCSKLELLTGPSLYQTLRSKAVDDKELIVDSITLKCKDDILKTIAPKENSTVDIKSNILLAGSAIKFKVDEDDTDEGDKIEPVKLKLFGRQLLTDANGLELNTALINGQFLSFDFTEYSGTALKLHALIPEDYFGLMTVYVKSLSNESLPEIEYSEYSDNSEASRQLMIFNLNTGWWEESITAITERKRFVLRKGINTIKVPLSGSLQFYASQGSKDVIQIGKLRLIPVNKAEAINPRLGYYAIDLNITPLDQACNDIALLDPEHEFLYNNDIAADLGLELNPKDISDNLTKAKNWFDVNNSVNPFVVSEIDADYLSKHINLSRFSKR